jgi:serine/threonine protein kinase
LCQDRKATSDPVRVRYWKKMIHNGQSCPTVMPVVDIIAIDEERTSMLTPYYPLPLSRLTPQPSTVVNMALCALCTVKAFSAKKICHADIKPANMMMQSSGRIIVSIDFGSSVAYGESIDYFTLFTLLSRLSLLGGVAAI